MSRRVVAVAACFALLSPVLATSAFAACKRLAFSVNDYGKEGPTKDALSNLDGYIKKWTSERGIKTYTVGKKDVSCELFLNFVVFDEHTCTAAAQVCWAGPMPAEPKNASAPKNGFIGIGGAVIPTGLPEPALPKSSSPAPAPAPAAKTVPAKTAPAKAAPAAAAAPVAAPKSEAPAQ